MDGEGELVEFKNCKHISNVHYVTSVEGNKITYENCLFVDGDTCDGYYTKEDEGKVPGVSLDGLKKLFIPAVLQSYKAWAGTLAKDTFIIPSSFYGIIFINSYSHSISVTYTRLSGNVETKTLTGSAMLLIKQKQYYEDQYNVGRPKLQDRLDVISIDKNASIFTGMFNSYNYNGTNMSDITITKIDGVPNINTVPMNVEPLEN